MGWKTYAKVAGAAAAVGLSFYGGYQLAATAYGKDIAELREDYATRATALEEEYREREKATRASLVAAWEERDAAHADAFERVRSLDDSLSRMRDENASLRRKLSGAGADSCERYREPLGRCTELLDESAGLLSEGAAVRLRDAADIDAVIKFVVK